MSDIDSRIKTIREMTNEAVERYVPTKIDDYYVMTEIEVYPTNLSGSDVPDVVIEICMKTGDYRHGVFCLRTGVIYKNKLSHIDIDVVIDHARLFISKTVKELVIQLIENTKGVSSK